MSNFLNLFNFTYFIKYYDHDETYNEHHHTKKKLDKHDFDKCLYENNYNLDKCKHYIADEKKTERTNENYQKCMKEAGDKILDKKYCEERYQNLEKNELFIFDDVKNCFEGKFKFNDNCITQTFTKNFSFLTKCLIKNLNEEALGINLSNMTDEEKKNTRNKLIEAEKCSKVMNITENTCKNNDLFHRALYICEKNRINSRGILKGLFDISKGIFSLIYILFIVILFLILFFYFMGFLWFFINIIIVWVCSKKYNNNSNYNFSEKFNEYYPIRLLFKIRKLNGILVKLWLKLLVLVLVLYLIDKFLRWMLIWDIIGLFPPESKIIFKWFDGIFFDCRKSTINQSLFCNNRNTWGLIEGLLEEQMKKTTDLSEKEIKDKINSWRDVNSNNENFTNYENYTIKQKKKIIENFSISNYINTEGIYNTVDKIRESFDGVKDKFRNMNDDIKNKIDEAKQESQ